jgi:DNA-binding MarR family transcriptional regulator
MSGPAFLEQGQALRDLKALEAIAESPSISQRDLSQRLGIALGLANSCLAKMARKGLIKVSRVNGRSLAYHLTPAGFTAKAKLSVDYARTTVDFYRTARSAVTAGLGVLAAQGVSRVAILGAGDVAEIVGIVCAHQGLRIVCVADDDPARQGTEFMGLLVGPTAVLMDCGCEAVVVAHLEDAEQWMELASKLVPSGTLVVRAI